MLQKDIIKIVLSGIGLASLASVVYFLGPLIAFGDWRPLENPIIRDIAVLLIVAVGAGLAGLSVYRRRRDHKRR